MNKSIAHTAFLLAFVGTTSTALGYSVRGKGRIMYFDAAYAATVEAGKAAEIVRIDGDGTKKPLARVRVQLMDSDADFDEVMAEGTTDANGDFSLKGEADDSFTLCDGCDRPDPYIKFSLYDENRVDIHDIWGFTYFGVTNTVEDTQGTINFGTWKFRTEDAIYPRLFAYTQKQYEEFTKLTGERRVPGNDGLVGVTVPELFIGRTPWTGMGHVHWPGDYFKASTIFHEFGHRIRHAADGDLGHWIGDAMLFNYARYHKMHEDSNLGFAFNEGWANFHASLLNSNIRQTLTDWDMDEEGSDEWEGNVAAKLYRLSASCGGFKNMWTVLETGKGRSISGGPAGAQDGIHSYAQFRTVFREKFPKCYENLLAHLTKARSKTKLVLQEESPSSSAMTQQAVLAKNALDKANKDASRPIQTKWTASRLSKLPETVRPSMVRLTNKRVSYAQAHAKNISNAISRFMTKVKPADDKAKSDGSYEASLAAAQAELIKSVAQGRLRQIHELQSDLKGLIAATKDARFKRYLSNLLARYAKHEGAIRNALARPTDRVPSELIPVGMQTPMTQDR